MSRTVTIDLGERSYPVLIGEGQLNEESTWAPLLAGRSSIAVVSNTTVGPLYGDRLESELIRWGQRVVRVRLPDGEAFKDWLHLQRIFDALLEARCDRKTLVIALGGGVVGDMAGFAASCYLRGVDYVQVPTTLLSQVDSSVGGKTGVNHSLGKNMIGAFYQPKAVVIDVHTIATLPKRERAAGFAEMVKHGMIADAGYFSALEHNAAALMDGEPHALMDAVEGSVRIKASVVAADERESGSRAHLNFGHTFGHAIEAGLGYGSWLHGEAVAAGMVLASRLSSRVAGLPTEVADELTELLRTVNLPVTAPDFGFDAWMNLMALDKKSVRGTVQFVLCPSLGSARVAAVEAHHLKAILHEGATLALPLHAAS